MEVIDGLDHSKSSNEIKFFGKGSTFLGIVALNVILTIITFGLYYPWAKAAYRKYIWNETELKDSRFVFTGTGLEMFKGFVIVYLLFLMLSFTATYFATSAVGLIVIGIVYLLFLGLIPLAIFGGWRYRVTRTSWRGIHFSFNGRFGEFIKLFLIQLLLTIITFGIYGAWMRVKIQKYLFQHTSLGGIRLDFHGQGETLFGINVLGVLLSYITLGLYIPVFVKNRFNFTIDNTSLSQGETRRLMNSTLKAGEAWKTLMVNFLLLIVTVGIAFPWTFMRTMRMYFQNIILPEGFDYDGLEQSEEDPNSATGDELIDAFDIDLGF